MPQRKRWHPTPLLLPGKSHGQRSMVGCSQWGREESDLTEQLHFHFSLSCIGEGNGNPIQCSCLENPRDRGAWWAAAYGVTQSRTRLKRLSSSQREGKRLTPWSEQVLFCLPWVWDHFYSNISSRKNQERKKLYCISLSVTFLYKHCLYMKKSLS